jgi:hypothetical protein
MAGLPYNVNQLQFPIQAPTCYIFEYAITNKVPENQNQAKN